ncbi:MAG: hypothetical protein ACREF3_14695, partial [Acetobacteraceae bacterium]
MAQPARSRRRRPTETTSPVAEAPSPAGSLIEIPSVLSVSDIGGLQQLHVFGRITSADPVVEVAIFHDDTITGRTLYPLVAASDSRYGFAITLGRRPGGADDPWHLEIAARHAGGAWDRAKFVVAPGPEPGKASVTSGAAASGLAATDPLPPVIMHIDRASFGPAQRLIVEGWVLAAARVDEVRIFADEQLLGNPRIGLARMDVAKWRPEYPNAEQSGFELTSEVALPAAVTRIRVLATAAGLTHETTRLLDRIAPAPPARPDTPRVQADRLRHEIRLHCDVAELAGDGQLSVIGWAVSPTGITSVAVFLDGAPLGDAEFGLARHDVGDEYITIPMARFSGFRYVTITQGPVDTVVPDPMDHGHEIRLIARNGLGDTRELVCPVHLAEAAPMAESDRAEFRVEIDGPPVIDGMVAEPVSGRLTIEGWAVCRPGIERVDVFLDGQALGDAHYGIARQDVARACPEWPQAARSGFAFHCPPRLLRNGVHSAELHFRALNGEILIRSFRFEISRPQDAEDGPTIRRRIARVEADAHAAALARIRPRARFLLVVHLRDFDDRTALAATLQSLRQQIYDDWRLLLLVDQASDYPRARAAVSVLAPELLDRTDIAHLTRTAWP